MKVENFAVYSALFVSASVVLLASPSEILYAAFEAQGMDSLSTKIQKRIIFYGLGISVTCHATAIFLAMAFTNALNECARDSDVIRMFAEGKGYAATQKTEKAFYGGVLFTPSFVLELVGVVRELARRKRQLCCPREWVWENTKG